MPEKMGDARDEDDVVMTDGANDTSMGSNLGAASGSRDGACDDDEGHDFGESEGTATVAVFVEQYRVSAELVGNAIEGQN